MGLGELEVEGTVGCFPAKRGLRPESPLPEKASMDVGCGIREDLSGFVMWVEMEELKEGLGMRGFSDFNQGPNNSVEESIITSVDAATQF